MVWKKIRRMARTTSPAAACGSAEGSRSVAEGKNPVSRWRSPARLRIAVLSLSWACCSLFICWASLAATGDRSQPEGYSDVLRYIHAGWASLTRSMTDCGSLADPKVTETPVLYVPADFDLSRGLKELETTCKVDTEHLPAVIHRIGDVDAGKLRPGLLYLPNPYVVPGGMFNEMYGWDSYFIIRGLLQDGDLDLARGMVENFFFEIEHYGDVLNANRTYYLTRSQPPFLTSMVRAVYEAEKASGHASRAWLERAYSHAVIDYRFWTTEPHLAGSTGLSRYYDFGEGPAPELGREGNPYYRGVAAYLMLHPSVADSMLTPEEGHAEAGLSVGQGYSVLICSQGSGPSIETARTGCDTVETVHLSRDFYKGDRSMRESGFDVSFRFGPFGGATHHYAAVGLNSLLYQTETDLEWMSRELSREQDAAGWAAKARERRSKMDRYCWNATRGLYFDYDFENGKQSSYEFATTFYPLWAGLASPEQAKAVAGNFPLFDRPGGIDTSTVTSGAQWDDPFGWAPLQLIAVEGLRRYGDSQDAETASQQFLSMVTENFRRDGTIREKYNVVTRSSKTRIGVGYKQNVIGFGWTNGVFMELLHELGSPR
jgi:alpha,alpha-trehalase